LLSILGTSFLPTETNTCGTNIAMTPTRIQ
jgi:hypothetical protein